MGLVIRKRISLDFLGEGYESAYLIFRSIPVTDIASIQSQMPAEDSENKNLAIPIMLDAIKKYFLNGKAPNDNGELEDVSREDLDAIDADTAIKCFQTLSGVGENLDNGSVNSSTPSIPTESPDPIPPSNT